MNNRGHHGTAANDVIKSEKFKTNLSTNTFRYIRSVYFNVTVTDQH